LIAATGIGSGGTNDRVLVAIVRRRGANLTIAWGVRLDGQPLTMAWIPLEGGDNQAVAVQVSLPGRRVTLLTLNLTQRPVQLRIGEGVLVVDSVFAVK